MDVGSTANAGNVVADSAGDVVVGKRLATAELNIDRGGETEVQDLIDDVRGLKVEDDIRIFLVQNIAEAFTIKLRGVVLFIKGDKNFAVLHIGERPVSEGQVERSVGYADVVQNEGEFAGWNVFANGSLNLGEDLLNLFDAGSGGCANMETKGAGVHRGEEVLTDEGDEACREDCE